MTGFARDRVLEGRWDHAIKTLECLEGISLDQIISILKGNAKLTGDSSGEGVGLEADNATKYKADLQYMFGGVWNNAGRFMRPYGKVTSWGPDDMTDIATMGRVGKYRHNSMYYADDDQRDVIQRLFMKDSETRHTEVLFKEVSNFPHPLVEVASLDSPQKALDAFLAAGRGLEERGYAGGRDRVNGIDEIMLETQGLQAVSKYGEDENGMPLPPMPQSPLLSGALDRLNKAWDAQDDFVKNHARYVLEITKQAGKNWLKLGKIDGKVVSVPQAPFENWCLWRGDGAHLALPWETVCPSGLKMFGDDPYHSDWMIGAGFQPDDMLDHSGRLSKLAFDMRRKVQAKKLGFKVAVLCGTGTSQSLKAAHPKKGEECRSDQVAVIPNAGPDYVAAAMTAGAVICEQGGAMAHLVTVSRERDVKIVRVENARKLYPVGMSLVVDCAKGDVSVPFDRVDYKMVVNGQTIDVDELPR